MPADSERRALPFAVRAGPPRAPAGAGRRRTRRRIRPAAAAGAGPRALSLRPRLAPPARPPARRSQVTRPGPVRHAARDLRAPGVCFWEGDAHARHQGTRDGHRPRARGTVRRVGRDAAAHAQHVGRDDLAAGCRAVRGAAGRGDGRRDGRARLPERPAHGRRPDEAVRDGRARRGRRRPDLGHQRHAARARDGRLLVALFLQRLRRRRRHHLRRAGRSDEGDHGREGRGRAGLGRERLCRSACSRCRNTSPRGTRATVPSSSA